MVRKNKRWICIVLGVVLVMACFAGCGGDSGESENGQEGTMVLRMASEILEGNVMYDLDLEICDEIYERTDGRIKIDFYPAGQLGTYDTVFEELMIGSIDMAQIFVPEVYDTRLAMHFLPGYARNFEECKVLYAQDSFMATKTEEIVSGLGIKLLGMAIEGFENVASVKPITDPFVPGAAKGVMCRTSPWELTRLYLDDMGYDTTLISWAEIPTSLQTGIVDAWIGGNLMYHYTYTGDIIKYSYVSNAQPSPAPVLMSSKTWDKLSPEDQQIFQDVIAEICDKAVVLAAEAEAGFAKKLTEEKGVEIVYATEEEMAEMAAYCREVTWPKYEDLFTKEIMDGLKEELQKHGFW